MKLKNIVGESSLSRIQSKMMNTTTGAISAYRSEYSKIENQQRNRSLLAKLMDKGYSVTAVAGNYIENFGSKDAKEVSEHSYFVTPRTPQQAATIEGDLINLGRAFDQDSVMIIKNGEGALVGTSRRANAHPKFDTIEPLGGFKGGKVSRYLSRVNGRPFVMGDIEQPEEQNDEQLTETYTEIEYPGTINGLRGISILAKKDWRDIEL